MKFFSYLESITGFILIYLAEKNFIIVSNKAVVLMLGYLLIFIGLSYILFNEEVQFEIDEEKELIHWKKSRILQKKEESIFFHQIKRVFIQRVGKASAFNEYFFISLELQSGDIINTGQRFSQESEAEDQMIKIIRKLS